MAQKSHSENETLNSNESVFVHVNATSFVSGEKLFYKLYLLNAADNKASLLSKIAYVELIGAAKKIIFDHKLFLEKGFGQGDFIIPSDLQTGNYKLVAYTKWMLNKERFFESEIFIINPFEKLHPDLISKSGSNTIVQNTNGNTTQNSNFDFQIPKKKYTKREKVTLKLQPKSNQNTIGNFSVSVRKADDLPSGKRITSEEFKDSKSTENSKIATNNSLPELRGEMIAGKIVSKSGSKEVTNKTVSLSIPGKNFTFQLAKTNVEGKFIFNIDKPFYSNDAIFQVVSEDQKEFDIQIEKNENIVLNNLRFEKSFSISPESKNALQERSIASQIENAYLSKKTDSIIASQKYTAFYEPIAKEYVLDNYTRFKTLKETSVEIIPEMYFSKKGAHQFLYLRDYSNNTKSNESALVLVDGLLLQNTDELYEYDSNLIDKISIQPGAYYYGNKVFNGIISIVTKTNDFESTNPENLMHKISLQRPTPKKLYFKQEYPDNKNERIPDYRNQLLWLPEADLETPISFYTSDVSGTFEIILEGFTSDGKPLSLKETFIVQ